MTRLSRTEAVQFAEVKALCYSGLDSVSFRVAVINSLSRILQTDQAAFAALDLDTGFIIHNVTHECTGTQWDEFIERAYLHSPAADPGRLASQRQRVYLLEQLVHDAPTPDPAVEVLLARGLQYEVQVSLASRGKGWGHLVLDRRPEQGPYTDRDLRLLELLVPHLLAGLRAATTRDALSAFPGSGIGVVILDPEGRIEVANGVAKRMLSRPLSIGRQNFYSALEIVTRLLARTFTEEGIPLVPAVTIIDQQSREFYRLSAERVQGSDGRLRGIVLIEPARPAEHTDTLVQLGLTDRETEVLRAVLRGETTRMIARNLQISPHTVQHHLRHIFEKVGVSSRRQLAAHLLGLGKT